MLTPESPVNTPSLKLRYFFIAVMLSYVPPALFFWMTDRGTYQHSYHILLVLLASGVATGRDVTSPRLRLFLSLSMSLNLVILVSLFFQFVFPSFVLLGAVTLLAGCALIYYLQWGWDLLKSLRSPR